MPVKTNRVISQSGKDEDKLLRQLIPVVLPGGKQPGGGGGVFPIPRHCRRLTIGVAGDVAVVTPRPWEKLFTLPILTISRSMTIYQTMTT